MSRNLDRSEMDLGPFVETFGHNDTAVRIEKTYAEKVLGLDYLNPDVLKNYCESIGREAIFVVERTVSNGAVNVTLLASYRTDRENLLVDEFGELG